MSNNLIIANWNKVEEDRRLLIMACSEHLGGAELRFTRTIKEAREHILELASPRTIITVGGDGTLTQAVLAARELEGETTMGVIRYDSGDYARALGFKRGIAPLLKDINRTRIETFLEPFITTMTGSDQYTRQVDLIRFAINQQDRKEEEKKYTMAMNWLGAAGCFARIADTLQEQVHGKKQYTKAAREGRKEMAKQSVYRDITVRQGGRSRQRVGSVASIDAFLGPYIGGEECVSPESDLSDGVMELITFKSANFIQFYTNLAQVKANTKLHLKSKNIEYDKEVTGFTVQFKEEQLVQYDGETHPERAMYLEAEILPNALTVITNRSR